MFLEGSWEWHWLYLPPRLRSLLLPKIKRVCRLKCNLRGVWVVESSAESVAYWPSAAAAAAVAAAAAAE